MYVKKFEGETLDEAIQSVKRELGPDAIILKTITNKGLKGAFKKGRIEITAAISEESYAKKSRVDYVLDDEQKNNFYKNDSESINKMINQYNDRTPQTKNAQASSAQAGYGNIGLNKVVNTVSKASSKLKSSLDDFLSFEEKEAARPQANYEVEEEFDFDEIDLAPNPSEHKAVYADHEAKESGASHEAMLELRHQLKHQRHQIELLEKKLFELTQNITLNHHTQDEDDYRGLSSLRMSLKTLDLDDKIVHSVLKKAHFELSKDELNDEDIVYDFALRELTNAIHTAMPLFSSSEVANKPVITVLLSESATGQTSLGLKLAVLKEDTVIVRYRMDEEASNTHQFAKNFFDVEIKNANNLSELLSVCRQATASGKSIVLDLKAATQQKDETKKVLESLKRGFSNIEVLLTVSAINSELYNRKIISKYKEFAAGVIISYMDQCLSFGSLINTHIANPDLPLKFFGTGAVVPDDIESATAERLIAGLFQIS